MPVIHINFLVCLFAFCNLYLLQFVWENFTYVVFHRQSPHEVPPSLEEKVYSQSFSTVIAPWLGEQIFWPELTFCQTEFLWCLKVGLATVAYSSHIQMNKPLMPCRGLERARDIAQNQLLCGSARLFVNGFCHSKLLHCIQFVCFLLAVYSRHYELSEDFERHHPSPVWALQLPLYHHSDWIRRGSETKLCLLSGAKGLKEALCYAK